MLFVSLANMRYEVVGSNRIESCIVSISNTEKYKIFVL